MDLMSSLVAICAAVIGAGLALYMAVIEFRAQVRTLAGVVRRHEAQLAIIERRLFALLQIQLDIAQRLGIDKRYSDDLLRAYMGTFAQEKAS